MMLSHKITDDWQQIDTTFWYRNHTIYMATSLTLSFIAVGVDDPSDRYHI